MAFFPNGAYCFQPAEMTTPCRWGLDEVDLLVEINNQAAICAGFHLKTMTLTVGLVIVRSPDDLHNNDPKPSPTVESKGLDNDRTTYS